MSEERAEYNAGQQPEAIIERPRNEYAIKDGELVDYRVWGWVKLSARFRSHIKVMKGAKLAIWLCIVLSIDENGNFSVTLKELQELTDYSHTEIINTIKELESGGYLSVNRGGNKTNVYHPEFAARGENMPTDRVKKVESTKLSQPECTDFSKPECTTPESKNGTPPFNRVKELIPPSEKQPTKKDAVDMLIDFQLKPAGIRKAFADYFKLTPNWEAKYNRQFLEWSVEINMTPEQIRKAADVWRSDKRFNWAAPTLKGIQEHWLELVEETEEKKGYTSLL